MFPLYTSSFPSSATDLERLLTDSLKRMLEVKGDPVSVREASYPHLQEMRISLDQARLRSNPPAPPAICDEVSPALQVDQLTLSALALSLGTADLDLSLQASDVGFTQGKDVDDQVVLALENAADGKVEIKITQRSLVALITELLQAQAKKQGITIEAVKLELQKEGSRSVGVRVGLQIKKLFLSASLAVIGHLELDDHLNLKISRLNCTGDGGVANIACGILNPYLRRIDGREFSLLSLPIGEMQLRDVQLEVGENITVTADFGSGKRG